MTVEKTPRAGALITETLKKASQDRGLMERLWDQVGTTARFAGVVKRGEYEQTPWRTILLGMVALLYLVNPLDLIPDALLIVGLLDDVTLMGFFLASLRTDLQRFEAWEANRAAVPVLDVTPDSGAHRALGE